MGAGARLAQPGVRDGDLGLWVRVGAGPESPAALGPGSTSARGLVPAGTLGRAAGRTCARNFIWGLQVLCILGL